MAQQYEPGHVREAAKEAAAVQAVEIAATLILVCIYIGAQVLQREASAPDVVPIVRGRWAKQSERGWATAAGACWRRAERFRREYERTRPYAY